MAMVNDKPMPSWRNFAAWSAVGAVFYILVVSGSALLLHENGMRQGFPSNEVAAKLGLGLDLHDGDSRLQQPEAARSTCGRSAIS